MEQPAAAGAADPGAKVEEKASHSPIPSWVVDMEKKMGDTDRSVESKQWEKHSIYLVPGRMKDMTSRKAYRPVVVSLGPFHHGEACLLPMEEHKQRALRHLVKRSGKLLREFVAAVEEVAQQLEDAYERLDDKWRGDKNRERFVELMVTDGCFLLEVMSVDEEEGRVGEDYAANDPVFSEHGYLYLFADISFDVIVLENQLPLLLLQKLVAVQHGESPDARVINKMVLQFLGRQTNMDGINQLGLHPLDIFHKSFCGAHQERTGLEIELAMPSATGLHEAGIHFKVCQTGSDNLQDIHFDKGVLTIPKIQVHDRTEKMLLNLIAFEHLHVGAGNSVTAYAYFMDSIIDTAKDVALLRSKTIVDNLLGSNEEVASLFNRLGNGAMLDPSSVVFDVEKQVNDYCRKRRNKWRANFMQTYLRNPWVFISLVAATVLLVATLLQTIYSVSSFYNSMP